MKQYVYQLLHSRPWICCAQPDHCRRQATFMQCMPMLTFYDDGETKVIDEHLIPVCGRTECSVAARQSLAPVVESMDESVRATELRICSKCGKTEDEPGMTAFKRCARCKTQYYCSPECQRSDWPKHKKGCRAPPA
jgi:hypothetical protein